MLLFNVVAKLPDNTFVYLSAGLREIWKYLWDGFKNGKNATEYYAFIAG